jgi:MFS family permease
MNPPRIKSLARIPRGVWVLGFVSLFMDTSSEIIHSILPMFLVGVLGLPVVSVGLIEGIAEATSQVTKAFSGAVSDRLGKRKLLAVLGYGLAAATKPIFPLAQGMSEVLLARFVDRVGKGIRGAPRDALIADIVPAELRGASFGLRQALDSVGAVAGPLLAVALMALTADNFRAVMWVAVIPAVVSVALLVRGIEETAPVKSEEPRGHPFRGKDWLDLGRPFWMFVATAVALMVPRFSEAFLLLRAQGLGLRDDLVPLVFVVMNVVFALTSFPAGSLSDRIGRKSLVAIGFGLLVVSHLVLAVAPSPLVVFAGAALWGLHLGLTQGVFSAIVADVAPARLRGTGFGLFNMATGVAMLIGSVAAGALWDGYGPAFPFALAAAVTAVALVAYLALPAKH